MGPYDEGYRGNEPPVYSTGHGFYNPYAEPEWKREKRRIRGSGNGIGLASLGYVAISFAAGTLMYIILSALLRYTPMSYEIAEWVMTLIIYTVSLAVPFGIYMLCIKIPLGVALPFRKPAADMTVGGVFVGLGVGVAASYVTAYLESALGLFGIGITMPEYDIPKSFFALILYLVAMVVAPAFIEEMIFRGVVMQSLRRFGDTFALVASALIFGIFHLNLIQMPYAFILGLCIGYFVMRTGSLWVGVLIHFVNNSVAVIFTLAEPLLSENAYVLLNLVYALGAVLCGIIAVCILLSRHRDMFRFVKTPSILSPGKRVQYFITSPALVIAMVVAVLLTLQYVYII